MSVKTDLSAWQSMRRRAGGLLQSDVNRRIFAAASVVASITLIVKLTALVRDQMIAARFGAGDLVDAYVTAFFLPAFVATVLGDAIATPLTKIYIDVREQEGPEAAQALFSRCLTLGISAFMAAWAFLWLTADLMLRLVASGFEGDKLELTRQLYVIMLPCVLLGSLAGVLGTMLSGRERFSLAAWASLAPPLLSTTVLFLPGSDSERIRWLSWAMVIGTVVQLLILIWGMSREQISAIPAMPRWTHQVRLTSRRSVATLASNSVFSGMSFVDQAFAAALGAGSVAMLSFGNKLIMPLMTVSTTAISTAVFPYFARMIAKHDYDGVRNTLRFYTRAIFAVTIPLALIIIVGSPLIIRLIFERGAFTPEDTVDVSRVQQVFALMIPVYSVGVLHSRVLLAMQANRLLFFGSLVTFTLNAIGTWLLAKWIGVAGIALSTVINYAFTMCYLHVVVERALRDAEAGA